MTDDLTVTASQVLNLRPAARGTPMPRRGKVLLAVWLAVVCALSTVRLIAYGLPEFIPGPPAALAVVFLFCWVRVRRYRSHGFIRVYHDRIESRGLSGHVKHIPLENAAAVVLVEKYVRTGRLRGQMRCLVLSRSRAPIFEMPALFYAPSDVAAFADSLNRPVLRFDTLTEKQLAQRYPGSVSWARLHPHLFAALLATALLAAIVLVSLAVNAITSMPK